MTDCCQLFEWFETIWQTSQQARQCESIKNETVPGSGGTSSIGEKWITFTRIFLSAWTLVKCYAVKDLIKQKSSSNGI